MINNTILPEAKADKSLNETLKNKETLIELLMEQNQLLKQELILANEKFQNELTIERERAQNDLRLERERLLKQCTERIQKEIDKLNKYLCLNYQLNQYFQLIEFPMVLFETDLFLMSKLLQDINQ